MQITCLSASNTKLLGDKSTSTRVCALIGDIISKKYGSDISINILPLVDFNLTPCILCGECSISGNCIYDSDFNNLYTQISKSDAIFLVVPHYSPIPSKLMISFEKLNELAYAGWLKNPNFTSTLSNIPVGIIGHGGCPEDKNILKHYHDNLVAPVARNLQALSLNVVGYNDEYPYGVTFGLKDNNCLIQTDNSIFPDILQDFEMIEDRIKPLIFNVVNRTLSCESIKE
jgi:hypothetical protein